MAGEENRKDGEENRRKIVILGPKCSEEFSSCSTPLQDAEAKQHENPFSSRVLLGDVLAPISQWRRLWAVLVGLKNQLG